MRKVEVSSYQEQWPIQFREEAEKIKAIFGEEIIAIHHIGSTAVPNLDAKPIIDLMPIVKQISHVDSYDDQMRELGYDPRGEYGIEGRRYFPKGEDHRTHHVHMFQAGSRHIERHLAFRDYLKEHPTVKEQYGQLKKTLAQQFPFDMDAYIRGKNDFVQSTEEAALAWYKRKQNS